MARRVFDITKLTFVNPEEYVRLETADEHRTVTLAHLLLLSKRHGALLLVRSCVAGGPRTLPGSSPR